MNSSLLTLLSISLSGTVLAVILFALKPLLQDRVTKAFSYYIWLLVLLRMALPFGYGINLSDFIPASTTDEIVNVNTDNMGGYVAPESVPADMNLPMGLNTDGANAMPSTDKPSVARDISGKEFNLLSLIKDNLTVIWVAGMLVSICWYGIAYMVFKKRIKRACTAPHADDIVVFEELRGSGTVRFACSSYTNTPMLIGVFQPVVIVPQLAYKQNEMEPQLRNILRHELMHYRRHDTAYKWFAVLVNSVHWFNPLIYLVSREIGRACELSCDEAVIRKMSPAQRQGYGNTLLALSAKKRLPVGVMATTLGQEKQQLKGRLLSIMNYKKKSNLAIALMLALALMLAGCATVYAAFESGGRENKEKNIVDQMISSMEYHYDEIRFAVPEETNTEKLKLHISGRAEYDDGFSSSLHFLDEEVWEAGKTYFIPYDVAYTDLLMVASYTDEAGIETEQTYDLLPLISGGSAHLQPEEPSIGLPLDGVHGANGNKTTSDDETLVNLIRYKPILDLYYEALYEHQTNPSQWQPDQYDTEYGLLASLVNPYWAWGDADDILEKEGFAFLDLNDDDTDELVLGWVGNESWNMDEGYVFAIYTIMDGEIVLAVEGWERNRYVIGENGYLYQNGSSGASESTYIKYKFSLEQEGFLVPIEKLYSQPNLYAESARDEIWWEHVTNADDIGTIEFTGKHEELWMSGDEAIALGEAWLSSGIAIDYTRFSEYAVGNHGM